MDNDLIVRVFVSDSLPSLSPLLGKQELAEIVDELSGLSNVRSGLGMTGLLTNGVLPRGDAYVEGVILALCPFVSAPQYWDDPNKSSTNDSESGKD